MPTTFTLIDLAGSIALLLLGTQMVQTGMQRAFGVGLQSLLARSLRDRGHAFVAGMGATAVLQGGTATGSMTAGLAAAGRLDLVPALAVMLGERRRDTDCAGAVVRCCGSLAGTDTRRRADVSQDLEHARS